MVDHQEESLADSSFRSGATGTGTTIPEELFKIWQRKCLKTGKTSGSSSRQNIQKQQEGLRVEARRFFHSIITSTLVEIDSSPASSSKTNTTTKTTILQTKASHEEALALLVQELRGPFSSSSSSSSTNTGGSGASIRMMVEARVMALYALIGALEGCTIPTTTTTVATLSLPLVELLGKFFVSHCGPLKLGDGDDYDDDDASPVRDAAVLALTVLLRSRSGADFEANMRIRLHLARNGVESRCAADEDDDGGSGDDATSMGVTHRKDSSVVSSRRLQMGLSSLPRSRRSICFDLIRAGVDSTMRSTTAMTALMNEDLEMQCVAFCVFVASCLLGESDPRCLLQLLQLFAAMAGAFAIILGSEYPWEQVLDAVAPYYPIQFTPPPNNIHQITKPQLRQALLQVFDACQNQETCLQVLAMILERILPEDSDDVKLEEKREAVEDLTMFLSLDNEKCTGSADSSAVSELNKSHPTAKLELLDVASVRHLSGALQSLFREASLQVAQTSPDTVSHRVAKEAGDACRLLIAQVAQECETASNSTFWEAFVGEALQSMSTRLQTPCRISVAYMASLASCGGPKTLRRALEDGLAPLVTRDSFEDTATAVYGIGAFFSACNTSIHQAERKGIFLYPHPLKAYRTRAIRRLHCNLVAVERTEAGITAKPFVDQDSDLRVRIAAVRAMESVLLASPALHLGDDEVDTVSSYVQSILDPITSNVGESLSRYNDEDQRTEWLSTCSKTIGYILGHAIGGKEEKHSRIEYILDSEQMKPLFEIVVFPALLTSASGPGSSSSNQSDATSRYDRLALATACSVGPSSALRVVSALVAILSDALKQEDCTRAEYCASALNVIFRRAGPVAAKAYHSLSEPCATPMGIIKSISSIGRRDEQLSSRGIVSNSGTSMVKLPASEEEREIESDCIAKLYNIASLLRPAYETQFLPDEMKKLLTLAANTLPPLTAADSVKLTVVLPLLSAALVASAPFREEFLDNSTLESLLTDLAEFTLSSDHHSPSRSHASLCLQTLISRHFPSGDRACPAKKIVVGLISPTLKKVMDMFKSPGMKSPKDRRTAEGLPLITELLSVLSLLGSAAACRSSSSSTTADQIIVFLVDIACSYCGSLFVDGEQGFAIDLSVIGENSVEEEETRTDVVVAAASLLGSVLSTDMSNLSKQRLTTLALKRLEHHVADEQNCNANRFGLVASACHITCAANLQSIDVNSRKTVADIVSLGFAKGAMPPDGAGNNCNSLKKPLLAALLKLLVVAPSEVTGNSMLLLTGIMRFFAAEPHPTSDVAVKLLALQALESLARLGHGRNDLATLRPAVTAILAGAMNHPSSLIRQAAVEVRNVWYVVGQL